MHYVKSYFSSRILSSLSYPRTLWKNISHILHRNTNRTFPTSSPLSSLPQLFATYFFLIKLQNFTSTYNQTLPPFLFTYPAFTPSYPFLFYPCHITGNYQLFVAIIQFIQWSPSHPFPLLLKSSLVSPLLKTPSLNKDDLSNYRPIANITFISKLIEKNR